MKFAITRLWNRLTILFPFPSKEKKNEITRTILLFYN